MWFLIVHYINPVVSRKPCLPFFLLSGADPPVHRTVVSRTCEVDGLQEFGYPAEAAVPVALILVPTCSFATAHKLGIGGRVSVFAMRFAKFSAASLGRVSDFRGQGKHTATVESALSSA